MAAMTLFHAAKCCKLVNGLYGHTASAAQRLCSIDRQFLIYNTFVLVCWYRSKAHMRLPIGH